MREFITRWILIFPTQTITAWLLGAGQLGRKSPRPGYARMNFCPPCSRVLTQSNLLSDSHVLFGCRILDNVREAQGISEFVRSARYSKCGAKTLGIR